MKTKILKKERTQTLKTHNHLFLPIVLFLLVCLGSCSKYEEITEHETELDSSTISNVVVDAACEFNNSKDIALSDLIITSGAVTNGSSGFFNTSTPVTRAEIDNDRVQSAYAKITFRYNGESDSDIPLSDGTMRRQIGLKLRSKNTCNILYVMWWLEPYENLAVSIKSNPGMMYHSQCGDQGYTSLYADTSANPFPPVSSMSDGNYHELSALLKPISDSNPNGTKGDDFELIICVDGYEVWRKNIYNLPVDVSGISGFRTDNGNFDFDFDADVNKSDDVWLISYSGGTQWNQLKVSNSPLQDLAYGDFNGDGKTDVLMSSNSTAYVSLGGNTNWLEWNNTSYDLTEMRLGDFDGDGKTDLFRSSGGKWYVSLGGDTAWIEWGTSNVGVGSLKFGDFNGDGKTDVFKASAGKWQVSLAGQSSWVDWETSNVGIADMRFGDFNGDGTTDIFRASGGKWYVSLQGQSGWIEWKTSNIGIESLKFGDLNGDGTTDVLIESNGKYKVSYGGNSNWVDLIDSDNIGVDRIELGDFDGDGESDIFKPTQI